MNATGALQQATTTLPAASHHAVDPFLALAAAGAALIVVAALALLLTQRVPRGFTHSVETPGPQGSELPTYRYEGLRAEARRVFLELRRRVGARLGFEPIWATARELARLSRLPTLGAFASLYERVMYSPGQPEPGSVEELRGLARLAENHAE